MPATTRGHSPSSKKQAYSLDFARLKFFFELETYVRASP
jgi:hypothetical protein